MISSRRSPNHLDRIRRIERQMTVQMDDALRLNPEKEAFEMVNRHARAAIHLSKNPNHLDRIHRIENQMRAQLSDARRLNRG